VAYRYLVVFEKEGNSYGASVPDLPGCVAVARTLPAVKKLIRDGIALHVEDMISRGEKPPKPRARVDYVDAKVA
jgi:predicted RNase H-like HicB family nuclease